MQVCAIKNTEPKNVNIPTTAVFGGAAALGLRQILPVTQAEIDTVMFNKSDIIKQNHIQSHRDVFIKNIEKKLAQNPENESLKLFLTRANAKTSDKVKEAKNAIKNAPKNIQNAVAKLEKSLAEQLIASRKLTEANIKTAVKHARPHTTFLLPGIALGALGGYVYNVVGTISKN